MKVSVILAHPNKESFNHAVARTACDVLKANKHETCFHDLYEEKFDPVLPLEEIWRECSPDPDVKHHCEEIASADGIVVVHPNWWGQPPAILKGWVDRVLRPGVAYEFAEGDSGEGVPVGLLQAQSVIVFNTSNTPEEREQAVFGDPLEAIWENCVFELCGVKNFYRRTFSVVVTSTVAQRKQWLEEVRETVGRYFPVERRREPRRFIR